MKNYKMFICIFLVFAMLPVLLSGCSKKTNEPSAAGDPASNTAFSYSDGIDENGFWKDIKALDYVETFNYQAVSIPGNVPQISDDDLQTEIDKLLANYSTDKKVTDRAIVDGDTVNIDYVGSVDGVEFEGGSTGGRGTDVTAGSTNYIDDFLVQIIGHTPGETMNVEVTFPANYQEASLQGKDALFVTTINYITEKETVDLTDTFVSENLSDTYHWKTVDEMKKGMRTKLEKSALQNYIRNYLTDEVAVLSVPEQLTKYQENAMVNFYRESAKNYNVGLEEYLNNAAGVSNVDALIESNKSSNLKSATYALVTQAVAEDANLSVSDEDLVNFFAEYVGSSDYSSYEEQYGLPYLKQVTLCQKVLDYISDHAVIG